MQLGELPIIGESTDVRTGTGVPERLDLNLLPVLVAVDDHRSVTQAALALSMSQPALSSALGKLRHYFGDPLFVRTAAGMQPTERASTLVKSCRAVLGQIEREIAAAAASEPASVRQRFTFALSDAGEMVFLPRILSRLQQLAPEATVQTFDARAAELETGLERGTVDLAIGHLPDLRKSSFFEQRLFTTRFVTVLRSEHPLQSARLSWESFRELEHVAVQVPGSAHQVLERFLAAQRIERQVVLTTPNAASIASVIAQSDLAVTVGLPLAEYFCRLEPRLRIVALPLGTPRIEVKQHWHRKYHHDARSRWLREVIAEILSEKPADASLAS